MDTVLIRHTLLAGLLFVGASVTRADDAATSATLERVETRTTAALELKFPRDAETPIFAITKRGSGPPMLLVSGQVSDERVWNATIGELEKTHTCHLMVPAGFGGLAPIEPPYLEGLKNGLIAYMKAEDLHDVVLVGHSMSGYVALWTASEEHERLRAVVSIEGPAYPPTITGMDVDPEKVRPKMTEVRDALKTMGNEQFRGICMTLLRVSTRSEENRALAMDMAAGANPPTLGEVNYVLSTNDLRPKLRDITVPVMYMASFGQVRSDATMLALKDVHMKHFENVRRFKYVQFRDAYHLIMMDAPQQFTKEIADFLADLPAERPIPSPTPTPAPTASPAGSSSASPSPTP